MLNNGGVKVHYLFDGWYKQAIFELTMKNFRLFETEAEHNDAVIEECSVSYVVESNKLYTTPENNGEITFKILVEIWDDVVGDDIDETITLKAVKGMTWGEFIDSEYNTLNFTYLYNTIWFDYNKTFSLRYNYGDCVGLDDIIIPNYEYVSAEMEG